MCLCDNCENATNPCPRLMTNIRRNIEITKCDNYVQKKDRDYCLIQSINNGR